MSPLEGGENELEQERFHDQELAQEIGARKRAVAERSIKLTAVLLASRKMLGSYSRPHFGIMSLNPRNRRSRTGCSPDLHPPTEWPRLTSRPLRSQSGHQRRVARIRQEVGDSFL